MNYRKKINYEVIQFPEGFEDEDRGLTECCKAFLVLADTADAEDYKNDITGVWIKKSELADVVTFTIEKCGDSTSLTNLGTDGVYPQDDLMVGFMYDWRQYLTAHGAGTYKISVSFTISGVTGGYTIGMYKLMPYSIENASTTVRIKTEFNSYYERKRADFSNSNFVDTLRFKGFFGDEQPNTEINNLVDKGKTVIKTTREDLNSYDLTSGLTTYCVATRFKFHMLNEDGCYITDHNPFNFSYQIFNLPVVLTEAPNYDYKRGSRKAVITAKFGDRKQNDKSFYNIQ
jgi:hypothetical protein